MCKSKREIQGTPDLILSGVPRGFVGFRGVSWGSAGFRGVPRGFAGFRGK